METKPVAEEKRWSGGRLFFVGIFMVLISRLFAGGLIGDLLMIFGAVMAFGGLTRIDWKASVLKKEN